MDNRTLRKLKRIHRQLGKTKTSNYSSMEEIKSVIDIQMRISHLIVEVEKNKK